MRLPEREFGSVVAVVFLASDDRRRGRAEIQGVRRGEALITVEELKQLLDAKDPKLVVLAVVEPASYKAGHIPTSINVWRPDYEQQGRPAVSVRRHAVGP